MTGKEGRFSFSGWATRASRASAGSPRGARGFAPRTAAPRGLEVVGDIEIFAREARARGKARVIGITGTNGKSTVTALAGGMGRAAGLETVVAGGDPDLYVIELSSYQLETTSSLELDAAAMLNLTQDHMDRYDSMA